MSTPMRHLVCRTLSPNKLSPTIIKSPTFLNTVSPYNAKQSPSSRTFVKRLLYPISPNKINCQIEESSICQSENCTFDAKLKDIKIIISDADLNKNLRNNFEYIKAASTDEKCDTDLPFINTPDRIGILKDGLCAKSTWNVLGKGSYGTVIQAIYKGEKVAVKIVPNHINKNSIACEKNSLKLSHESIVKTIKVVCESFDNYGMVVMQDCSNYENMQNLLENTSFNLTLNIITNWLLQVCDALQYCHQNGVIHLDLKPKNILVHKHSKCKICDFGNSLDVFSESKKDYVHQGTVVYTAPEIFQAKTPDVSADIYSLGITMWQMNSRVMPYDDVDNKEALIYFVVKHNLRPVSPKNVDVWYFELYTQCWQTNVSLRPSIPNIIEVLNKNNKL